MQRTHGLAVATALLLGCKPELPSLDYHGERIRVGSDVVDRVCDGTLHRIDREVEQIETRLDLPIQESPLDVYIVDRGTVAAYCGSAANCLHRPLRAEPFVVVDHRWFERAIAHELVHARLSGIRSVPLFHEGIAEALSPPSCPRSTPTVELSEVLGAKTSEDLRAVRDGNYVADELVAWLLQEFGPGKVLNLMRSAGRGSSSSAVRAEYLEHFDRQLELDLLDHLRTEAELDLLPPQHFGCLFPTLEVGESPVHLVADLDCDSEHVHNNFAVDDSGYVEWTVHVDHEQPLRLVGVVPVGTSLTIEECRCVSKFGEDVYRLARPFEAHETLQPGTYRLRWTGELDVGLSLDVELLPLSDD